MGQSTFNLSQFFNRLGIKNANPNMLESVQPVISVGDLAHLTPQYVPPTQIFGGDTTAVAAQFSVIQIECRAPGGAFLPVLWGEAQTPLFGRIATPETGLTPLVGVGPFSNDDIVSVVSSGTVAVAPLNATVSPNLPRLSGAQFFGGAPLYLPPGATLIISATAVNAAIINWWIMIQEIVASEMPA